MSLCLCGCGQETAIATRDDARYGAVKGLPLRYVNGGHSRRRVERRRVFEGYVLVYAPGHPRANNQYVFEHILVVEVAIGRFLPRPAVVHHVDGDTARNVNQNLVVLENQSEHRALHSRLTVLRAGGDPWTQRMCCVCHQPKDTASFNRPKGRAFSSDCIECSRKRCREYQRRKREEAA